MVRDEDKALNCLVFLSKKGQTQNCFLDSKIFTPAKKTILACNFQLFLIYILNKIFQLFLLDYCFSEMPIVDLVLLVLEMGLLMEMIMVVVMLVVMVIKMVMISYGEADDGGGVGR